VKTVPDVKRLDKIMGIAAEIIEQEDMVPAVAGDTIRSEESIERRKMDLALNLVDQYLGLLSHWHWGDAVIEWNRQCEITSARGSSYAICCAAMYAHAGRSSFVTLLETRQSSPRRVLEKAVGCGWRSGRCRRFALLRSFLFYLNKSVAQAPMTPGSI